MLNPRVTALPGVNPATRLKPTSFTKGAGTVAFCKNGKMCGSHEYSGCGNAVGVVMLWNVRLNAISDLKGHVHLHHLISSNHPSIRHSNLQGGLVTRINRSCGNLFKKKKVLATPPPDHTFNHVLQTPPPSLTFRFEYWNVV